MSLVPEVFPQPHRLGQRSTHSLTQSTAHAGRAWECVFGSWSRETPNTSMAGTVLSGFTTLCFPVACPINIRWRNNSVLNSGILFTKTVCTPVWVLGIITKGKVFIALKDFQASRRRCYRRHLWNRTTVNPYSVPLHAFQWESISDPRLKTWDSPEMSIASD